MFFWGMKRIFSFKRRVDARKWEEVTDKRKDKIYKDIIKKARKIFKAYKNEMRQPYHLVRKFMFKLMRRMMKKNTYYLYDRNYWEQQGWLGKKRPF